MDDDKILSKGYVREQKPYTEAELLKLFNCEKDRLEKIIRLLRYNKVIKINKSKDKSIDMSYMADEVIDVTDAITDVSGYNYTFTYVGMVIINNVVLKCYPKYIDNVDDESNLVRDFKQILEVLKKHEADNAHLNMLSDIDGERNVNLLEMMLFLLYDYYEHGVYVNHKYVIESNGQGAVLWDRTVNQIQPLIVNNRPYYMEWLTKKRVDEQENYFKRLHECILTECSKKFTQYGLFGFFNRLSPVELSDAVLDDFGDTDYILYRIERELGEQFTTRKQQLLKLLHTYISKTKGAADDLGFVYYGTNAFHKVWETVCANVMYNNLSDKLDVLSKKTLGDLHSDYEDRRTDKLISIIAKPKWVGFNYVGDTGTSSEADTLIPDIISIFPIGDEKCFAILDAKYYRVQFTPEVSGQPGIGDVTKQYLYNLAYKDFIEKHNFDCVWNCFLMPVNGAEFVKKGLANLKILEFINFGGSKTTSKYYKDEIDIILMPASTMFEWYLDGVEWNESFYYRVIHLIDSGEYGESR